MEQENKIAQAASEQSLAPLCDVQSSCLVVVDIQQSLAAAMPQRVLDRLLRSGCMLVAGAHKLSVPVLVTLQYPKGLGPLAPQLEKLLPENAQCFDKTAFSILGAKNFSEHLERLGRRQVILFGMEAHICIVQSALQLQERGYQVFVVGDAVCSRIRENYESALQRMRVSGISITTAESILFEWLRDARHESFRELSQLVG